MSSELESEQQLVIGLFWSRVIKLDNHPGLAKHSLNTVVTKDTFLNFFFILYCDFVFLKSSIIYDYRVPQIRSFTLAVACSVKQTKRLCQAKHHSAEFFSK